MTLPSHGSNPHYLYKSLNLTKPDRYSDFSANLNPIGPPLELKERWNDSFEAITTYPDPKALSLTKKLANEWNVDEANVLIGNGGAELISLVGRFLAGKRVCIVQPTFSEYENACRSNGCEVLNHSLEEGDWELDAASIINKMKQVDALFLCSPNNPTGLAYSETEIKMLLDETKKHNCYLVMDEAFMDFLSDERSIIPYTHTYQKLIVLRSLTKMYAIPGLRIGYMVANEGVINAVKKSQPHWSVNALALLAGEVCLNQYDHVKKTRHLIQQERENLQRFFDAHSFQYSRSSVNFYLLRDHEKNDQSELLHYLLHNEIVPRHTYNFAGLDGRWLRFAIRTPSENQRLMEVLKRWRT
ncbi:threonine-phosphate decarboxylase CobD [Alkalihalobacillus sp. CinArs1]|uniref:threonine-phosphate decarboxylase CobD n=1 Tax=Alkalihalobacillus sp. CinArs1 TaxID=2995314 RepID=UPI0022DD8DEC|nr:threonine-phosphate decarboxylase CobD [Alkalihalobacillus sp. CinArs1]